MSALLTKEDVVAYIDKLTVVVEQLKNPVKRSGVNSSTTEYSTKVANAEIKFLEGTNISLWITLGETTITIRYTPDNLTGRYKNVKLQVYSCSSFRILDIPKGDHPALATNAAHLLDIMKYLVEVAATTEALKQMAELDKVLEGAYP